MRILSSLSKRIARAPRLWLSVLVLSILPGLWLSSRLKLEESFITLLPEEEPAVVELKRGLVRAGGSGFSVVAIDRRDPRLAERYADRLALGLGELPEVRSVEARRDLAFIRERALLYLSEEKLQKLIEELRDEIDQHTLKAAGLGLDLEETEIHGRGPLAGLELDARIDQELARAKIPAGPYAVGEDGKYLYVFAGLHGSSGEIGLARAAQTEIERLAEKIRSEPGFAKLEVRFSGPVVVRLEDDAFLRRDLTRASLIGFFAVIGILVLYTRRLRTLVLLGVPLSGGLSWTFAFAYLAVGRLNIISGYLVSVLSGLGIEIGIRLLLRYGEARAHGEAIEEAQTTALVSAGRPLVGSALVAAATFWVLLLAKFEGFREFGLIAGFGMLATLVFTLLGFPALNLSLERWRPMKFLEVKPAQDRIEVTRPWRAAILILVPIFALISILLMTSGKPRFRTDWREIKGDSPASDFEEYIQTSLGRTLSRTIVVLEDPAKVSELLEVIEQHRNERARENKKSGIESTLSIADLVPEGQAEKLPLLLEIRRQLQRIRTQELDDRGRAELEQGLTLTSAKPFGLSDVPNALRAPLETTDGRGTMILLGTSYTFYESDELIAWAAELGALRQAFLDRGIEATIVSDNWIAGRVFQIIATDGPVILSATILVVFLLILADFRNFRHALAVLFALLIGQVSIPGAMVILGMELNFINVAVIPIIVGVSIDNAIHILRRYLQEGPASISRVLRWTASASTLASATNLIGFAALLVSHHRGLKSVAELALVGVPLTFLSTTIFFPLALDVWLSLRRRKHQQMRLASGA